jgi:mycothiol synthase
MRVSGASFVIRPFHQKTDFPALLKLRAEIEAVDQNGTDTSEAALAAQMKWRGHDPDHDRWVIEAPDVSDNLIGHAWIFAQSPVRSIFSVAIHPAWRRQGLGSHLLARMITRAGEHEATQIVSGTGAANLAGDAFLRRHGFKPVGHNRFLTAPTAVSLPPPEWPPGYTVQSLAAGDHMADLVYACNGSYADMWGHRENTEPATIEYFQKTMQEFPNHYYPEGIFIAYAPDKTPAGVCFCRLERNDKKVIDSPGVVPEHRHLGLQRPLTLTGMHWLNEQAAGDFHLYTWGDTEAAVRIYQELGFDLTDENHFIEYLLDRKV